MDLRVSIENEITKKSFKLINKSLQKDGLILRVHHTNENSQKLRFLYTCFDETGNLLASSDNNGNVFLINISSCKFWGLPSIDSCTFLRFSPLKPCELLIGLKTGVILIVNIESALCMGKLVGHLSVPTNITFSSHSLCLTSSETEAIIWELENNTKLKILTLEKGSILKYVAFLPSSNNILGCYSDNFINIWELETFQTVRTISPSTWKNMDIKNFTFSCDSSLMILSSTCPTLRIYSLKTWKVLKLINLPEYIRSIRSLKFIALKNMEKSIVAILSGDGVLSFLNIDKSIVISQLKTQHEILKFEHLEQNLFVSCVLCTGNIEVYDVSVYIEEAVSVTATTPKRIKYRLQPKNLPKKIEEFKDELDEVLSIDKLRSILKEYGEYPEAYRTMIWEQLLQLPLNRAAYDSITKYQQHNAFENLDKEYSLENRSLKCLKVLLCNLVTWCDFFSHVYYLPVFAYPFVRVFQNRPIACFEAIATILLNWCQYWFEYFPLPPINILAIIENILLEFDAPLLCHLGNHGITSEQYAWPLLESAFSEVFTSQTWFIFWDHVLTNEPSFLICAVIAYNVKQRNVLLNITETSKFEKFYHKPNLIDVKKFLAKCYSIMEDTSLENHPRKYLNMFKNLERGVYPVFRDYPKVIIEDENQKLNSLKNDLENVELEEAKILLNKKKEFDKLLDSDLESIERKRIIEMKKFCSEKFQDEQVLAKQHLRRLASLRQKFDKHQKKLLNYSKSDLLRKRLLINMSSGTESSKNSDSHNEEKAETLLLKHYSELIKHKMQIEALLQDNENEPNLYENIKREHVRILKEIKKISESSDAENKIREYNVISSFLAMDDLIKKVESALAKELSNEYLELSRSETCLKGMQLQIETEELANEVSKLLNTLSRSKVTKSKSRLSACISSKNKSIIKCNKNSEEK